jgi:hypothetical protein
MSRSVRRRVALDVVPTVATSGAPDAVLYDNPTPSTLLLDEEQGCTDLFRRAQPD